MSANGEFITDGDPNVCADCGHAIGGAGRTDAELLAAFKSGQFLTAFGATDYSVGPPWHTTYYCGACLRKHATQ